MYCSVVEGLGSILSTNNNNNNNNDDDDDIKFIFSQEEYTQVASHKAHGLHIKRVLRMEAV